jgi:N,N'-diacetyllegionaminate synthase
VKLGSLDTNDQVVVIAELGNNHEGDMGVARELVEAAARAGADVVKLQAIDPRQLVRPGETARIEQLGRFRLSEDEFAELGELARARGLGFACTPFDLGAVQWLAPLVDAFKIASGDNNLDPLLAAAAATGHPVIVSMGMTDVDGARHARDVVRSEGAEFAALHCVSAYPTPPEHAALAQIAVLERELGGTIGYSDHTLGIDACVLAAAIGARILEKHFTLRHDFSEFRDHQLSAEPDELAELVARVRAAEELVGTPRIGLAPEEEPAASATCPPATWSSPAI